MDTPKRKYDIQKSNAKRRGIGWDLTFDAWWELWSPHWERRGTGRNDMCMCRKADLGPYSIGNVRIATVRENYQERALEHRTTHAQRNSYAIRTRSALPLQAIGWARGRGAFDEYCEDELTDEEI